jgi:hypothetical protein
VAQIDEVMIDERERLIRQGRLDRFDDVVHLRRIVIDAGAAEESAKLGRIRQRLVDTALKRRVSLSTRVRG